jgi:hypothetical protein
MPTNFSPLPRDAEPIGELFGGQQVVGFVARPGEASDLAGSTVEKVKAGCVRHVAFLSFCLTDKIYRRPSERRGVRLACA